MKKRSLLTAATILATSVAFAQLRPTNKDGINVFETPKTETEFEGLNVKIGGALTLPYTMLDHSNAHGDYASDNPLTLLPLTNNFGLPQANLFIKSNLADGIYLNFELYLASRHHNETWVKGGFLQFEKLPFLPWDFVDEIMEYTTLKVGQFDVNYGDAHFRRSDGGLTFYNPFMENHIMDEFATEIGAEVDVHMGDFTLVGALTNGQLNPVLQEVDTTQASNRYSNGKLNPALIGKLAYDSQVNEQFRLRVSGSGYYTAGSLRNTLFGGDRTGSNYYGVMYHDAPGSSNFTNGRFNPGFSDKVSAVMGNLFLKYSPVDGVSFESFTTIEQAKGRKASESEIRKANQFVTDLVVRFGADEQFYVGGRYNTLKVDMAAAGNVPAFKADINRAAIAAGWYMTNNIMAKIEYVSQKYNDFPESSIFAEAQFDGLMLAGSIAF
ncbi:MAG: hypothetical protein JJE08_05410 [Proteiniphilum sp.]|nr:hypothetical protein [Proteiniphilum sp.]